MSQKAYKTGSEFPSLQSGKLRLYSMRFCPFAERTRLILSYKQIPYTATIVPLLSAWLYFILFCTQYSHETINIHLKEKPEWYFERNPLGLVPALEKDGQVIYESMITCDYLDDVYPQNKLNSDDPYRKARDKIIMELFSKKPSVTEDLMEVQTAGRLERRKPSLQSPAGPVATSEGLKTQLMTKLDENPCSSNTKVIFQTFMENMKIFRSKGEDKDALKAYREKMKPIEQIITERGEYFGGEKPCMVDFMIWPWFERIPAQQKISNVELIPEDLYPNLNVWRRRMLDLPAVKEVSFDADTLYQYYLSNLSGSPNYDLGLEE